jgi:hypothetical protein
MNKNIRLNQKATVQILDDLMHAGFIKSTVLKDGTFGRKSLRTSFTKDGTKMVASYAKALRSIRNPTKRKVEAFNSLLTSQAIHYMREVGWSE